MADNERRSTAPSGSSVLWAAWRQGLKDLQNVVLNAFPQGPVAQHEEPGSIANPTPQVVTHEMGMGYSQQLEETARHARQERDRDRGLGR